MCEPRDTHGDRIFPVSPAAALEIGGGFLKEVTRQLALVVVQAVWALECQRSSSVVDFSHASCVDRFRNITVAVVDTGVGRVDLNITVAVVETGVGRVDGVSQVEINERRLVIVTDVKEGRGANPFHDVVIKNGPGEVMSVRVHHLFLRQVDGLLVCTTRRRRIDYIANLLQRVVTHRATKSIRIGCVSSGTKFKVYRDA